MKTDRILKHLREIRKAKGIRQEFIAGELGIDRTSYSKKELGRVPLTLDELVTIVRLLDVRWEDIFSGDNPKIPAIRQRLETIKTFPRSAQIDFTDYEELLKGAARDIDYLLSLVDLLSSRGAVRPDGSGN
ncbi:MAG: helix-turn-helix transcriptional regulator [Nitrospirota bacterium]